MVFDKPPKEITHLSNNKRLGFMSNLSRCQEHIESILSSYGSSYFYGNFEGFAERVKYLGS